MLDYYSTKEPPSINDRVIYFKDIVKNHTYTFLSEDEINVYIHYFVHNTPTGSLTHYELYTKPMIKKKLLKKLHDTNEEKIQAKIQAMIKLNKLSRIWKDYYYRPGGVGEKMAKKHFEEYISY